MKWPTKEERARRREEAREINRRMGKYSGKAGSLFFLFFPVGIYATILTARLYKAIRSNDELLEMQCKIKIDRLYKMTMWTIGILLGALFAVLILVGIFG